MKINGLMWVGICVTAAGWMMLLFGSYAEVPQQFSDLKVANLHKMAIATSLISSGLALILVGSVMSLVVRPAPAKAADKSNVQVTSKPFSIDRRLVDIEDQADGMKKYVYDNGDVEFHAAASSIKA